MEHLLENPHFWTSLALILLLAAIGKKLWAALTGMLDQRSENIKISIEQAQQLRNDAQELLEEYQRKHRESLVEASEIVAQARDLAANQLKDAKMAMEASLNRRIKAAMEKIAQAEASAQAEVRQEAVRIAIAASRDIIREHMDAAQSAKMIDKAIADLPARLH
jgi:F-type H+-transporting ATPase subunit b